jgi:predicted outer membrane repeat protein
MSSVCCKRIHRRLVRRAALLASLFLSFTLSLVWLTGVVRADTSVCGPIVTDVVWAPAGNDYIVTCDVQVVAGVTLTIEPGVVVKFDADTSLQIDGTLVAEGATFTSNQSSPARGDWGRIYFTTTSTDAVLDSGGNYLSGSVIQGSIIEWGGGVGNGAIDINSASPFIFDNVIRNNIASGVYAVGRSPLQTVVVRENTITDNSWEQLIAYNSRRGGGLYVAAGEVFSNTVNGNVISSYGGGIHATGSTLIGNTVTNNGSRCEGAGIHSTGSTLMNNTISGNTTIGCGRGGGVYINGGTLSDNDILGNATSYAGGGIYAQGNSTISGNTINDNTSGGRGGGVFASGGTLSENDVHGNASSGVSGEDGGGIYATDAAVLNNTISGNSAGNGAGVHVTDSNVAGNELYQNNAGKDGGGVYLLNQSTATDNSVHDNTAASGGGIYANGTIVAHPSASNNVVQDNTANIGGGIYAFETTLVGNTVLSNTAQSSGGGIYAENSSLDGDTVAHNRVNVAGHGSGVYAAGDTSLSYTDVVSNTAPGGTAGGVSVDGAMQMHFNNLYANQPYEAEVVASTDVSGTLNYWGPASCTAIPALIYDGKDAPGRGQMLYAPSLYAPAPLAQLRSPENLTLMSGTTGLTLSWKAIPALPNVGCPSPGTDGAAVGYRVYYDTDTDCAPYDGRGLPAGDSPIDTGAVSQLVLGGPLSRRYYVVVTAYDHLGRESAFSNAVVTSGGGNELFLPLILKIV